MLQAKRQRKKAPADNRRPAEKSAPIKNRPAVDYEVLARFRFQLREFLAFSEAAALEAGLTPQQHQALLAIKGFQRSDAVSVGDLARFLFIKSHTAGELVNRMTRLGLLSRTVDDSDGRRVLLRLTRKGEQHLRQLSEAHLAELQSASVTLSEILKSFRV